MYLGVSFKDRRFNDAFVRTSVYLFWKGLNEKKYFERKISDFLEWD